jgi:hypothetical protein
MAMNLACHWSILRVIDPLIAREKYIHLLGGSSLNNPTRRRGVSGLLCVARGAFLVAVAMVMKVVVGHWSTVAPCLHQHIPMVGIVQFYLRKAFILV